MRLSVAAFSFVAVLAAVATADDIVADKKSKSKSEKEAQEVSMENGADEAAQTQNRMEPDDPRPPSNNRPPTGLLEQTHTPEGYSLFQGDMLLTFEQMVAIHGEEFAVTLKNNGYVYPPSPRTEAIDVDNNKAVEVDFAWTINRYQDKHVIPYEIDPSAYVGFTQKTQAELEQVITDGLREIEDATQMFAFVTTAELLAINATGVNVPRGHFLRFENPGAGCFAYVGRLPFLGPDICACSDTTFCDTCQTVALSYNETSGESCMRLSTTVHEMLHAIGFRHEQSRTDRDDYVTIDYTNIDPSLHFAFDVATTSQSLETPYDFASVMHYGEYYFALDPSKPTIILNQAQLYEPFISYDVIGSYWNDQSVSNTDLEQIWLTYQCSTGPRNRSDVQRDGWCTTDCPCWVNAPHDCSTDDECQHGLVCGSHSDTFFVREEPACTFLYDIENNANVPGCPRPLPLVNPQPTRICQQPVPTNAPSDRPSSHPSELASSSPSSTPSSPPTPLTSSSPSATPSAGPSPVPSPLASSSPSSPPTSENEQPSSSPSSSPAPSASPSATASANPTTSMSPSDAPSNVPSRAPTTSPSDAPTNHPSSSPTNAPTPSPSSAPSAAPTMSQAPSSSPSASPSGDSDEPSSQPSAAPTSCPTGQVFIPTNYWVPPLDKPGMSCQHVRIKIPDHGEFACLPIGSGICRDNGGSMSKWRFGIEEVETPPCELSGKCPVSAEPSDTFPVLIDPALTRYPITGTTFTDSNTGDICRNGYDEAIRGCNYAGTTHVCIGEDIEANANRYSNERPYMFFYNEKTHQFLYQLVCDGIGEEGKLPQLKMVNHEALADATTVDYPIDMVKFKKGATPYTDDSNELWKMYVDWNGFEDPATRRRGKLASFIGVAHTKFCTEYVSPTDRACWKEDCSNVDTPAAYERPGCVI